MSSAITDESFAAALDAAVTAAIAENCRDAPQEAGAAQRSLRPRLRDARDAAQAAQTAAHQRHHLALERARQIQRTLTQATADQIRAGRVFHESDDAVAALRAEAHGIMAPVLAELAAADAERAAADAALAAADAALAHLEARPELQALERAEQQSFSAAIAELGRALGQPRWSAPALEHTPAATEGIAALGRPGPLTSPAAISAEATRLSAAIAERGGWPALSTATQTLLLTHLAARLRHLQDQPGAPRTLRALFSRLTAWSATHRPGFVHGLAQAHGPQAATWLADAQRTWDELAPRLAPEDPAPAPAPTRKRRDAPPPAAVDPLPDDWPLRDRLRDARVLLLGSDVTQDQLALVRTTFGFAILDHTSGLKPRRVQASQTAIGQGRYDLVIILTRWLNHQASKSIVQACKGADVPLVQADGYGISTLRQVFEEKLADP